jgi:hypothetical protein
VASAEARDAAAWRHSRARRGAPWQLRAGVQERGESCGLLKLEQRENKAQLTWGRRRPRRPMAAVLSTRHGVEGVVTGIRCPLRATGNRVRAF